MCDTLVLSGHLTKFLVLAGLGLGAAVAGDALVGAPVATELAAGASGGLAGFAGGVEAQPVNVSAKALRPTRNWRTLAGYVHILTEPSTSRDVAVNRGRRPDERAPGPLSLDSLPACRVGMMRAQSFCAACKRCCQPQSRAAEASACSPSMDARVPERPHSPTPRPPRPARP